MDIFSGLDLGKELSSFKQSTSQAMSGVKENTLTPADTTGKRLKEGIALKNARDTQATTGMTNYKDRVVNELDGIIGALSGGLLNTKDLTKAVRVGRDGVTFSDDAILGAIGSEVGYPVNGKSGAMRKIAGQVTAEFKKITGVNIGGLLTTDGQTFRANKNWRGQVGSQLLNMLGNYVGIDEFIDVSVKGALYNSILYETVGYGMSGSYGLLWGSYPKGMELIRRDAFLEAARLAITNGDIESLQTIINLIGEEGRNVLLSKYPNFVEQLFGNFKFDDDVYPEDYPTILAKVQIVLNQVMGPAWYLKYTSFGDAYNMAVVARVSPDMKKLLIMWDEIAPLVACAGMYDTVATIPELRRQFKDAAKYPF